jgi:transcriptional antiterminator NusG
MGMEDEIFSVLVPVEERVFVKDGKSKKVTRKLYPSYVLVEMRLNDQSWYVVRHTPGVTGFVGAGNHPIPLSEKEVKEIMNKIGKDQSKPKIEMNLKPGDIVKVKSGPFEGQVGPVVEIVPEKGKVKFTVTVFGRETIVETDYMELDKL